MRQTVGSRAARRINSRRQRLNWEARNALSCSSNAPTNSASGTLIGGRGRSGGGEAGAHLTRQVIDRLLERADAPRQLAHLGAIGGGGTSLANPARDAAARGSDMCLERVRDPALQRLAALTRGGLGTLPELRAEPDI